MSGRQEVREAHRGRQKVRETHPGCHEGHEARRESRIQPPGTHGQRSIQMAEKFI